MLKIFLTTLVFQYLDTQSQAKPEGTDGLGEVQAITKNGYMNSGLMALTGKTEGVTASHILENTQSAHVNIQGKTYHIKNWRRLRPDLSNPDIRWPTWAEIESDIVIVELDEEPPPNVKRWEISLQSPTLDSTVWIPKRLGKEIQWHRKIVSVVSGYGLVAGTPKGPLRLIRWLGGLPNSDNTNFSIGDSGGPWIHEDKIVAVTSRLSEVPYTPDLQTIYGSGTWKEPSAAQRKQGFPALIPLGIGILLLWLANSLAKSGKTVLDKE